MLQFVVCMCVCVCAAVLLVCVCLRGLMPLSTSYSQTKGKKKLLVALKTQCGVVTNIIQLSA